MGLRYRLGGYGLTGKPDIVFVSSKVAIFVDGDYWHGNQWRIRNKKSLKDQLRNINNSEYWEKKITGNIERDRKNNELLEKGGWRVLRFWESDIKKRLDSVVEEVVSIINRHKE